MLQLPFAGLQSFRDLAQRFGLRQLAEQHGHELSPTAKAARVPLGSLLSHRGFKPIPRDQLENLAEDAAYSFQGEVSPVHWIRSLAELNPNYQRLHLSCCGANLDTSDTVDNPQRFRALMRGDVRAPQAPPMHATERYKCGHRWRSYTGHESATVPRYAFVCTTKSTGI